MAESKELKRIKKLYGENFMHLCRELFPTLLEQEGLLTEILTSLFAINSRTLYEDIVETDAKSNFKAYIYSKVDVEKDKPEIISKKTPYELLEEAGYDLYECNSEEEIQSFKKWYEPGEELCTFSGGRLDKCVVFWAVRKDADNIKRENFEKPRREDEYGTSVMGIQFNKMGQCMVSIKNRYNHTVNNPDATYGNDLDKIIPGLTQSFADLLSERGLELNKSNIEKFCIPRYTVAGDGKYYKYNKEINGIYYCPGNIIIDCGKVIQLEPEKQVLMDCFILDKESKTIKLYDESIGDCFVDTFEDIDKIKMKKSTDKQGKMIIMITLKNSQNPITIVINKNNQIIEYENQDLTNIGNDFLLNSNEIKRIVLPNVKEIGDNVCYLGKIEELNISNLERTGNRCFGSCNIIELNMPKLREVGLYCFTDLNKLKKIEVPSLERIGNRVFESFGSDLQEINFPKLTVAGNNFLKYGINPCKLNMPNIEQMGDNCLTEVYANLHELSMPKLRKAGNNFLKKSCLEKLDLPMLEQAGDYFIESNAREGIIALSELRLPKLKKLGSMCLGIISDLDDEYVDLPNLEQIGKKQLKCDRKRLLTIIKNNIKRKNIEQKKITPKNIAELDIETKITRTESNWAQQFVERIKNIFRKKDNYEREK